MPLSDWREGEGHLDAAHGSIHDPGYLQGNVAGGEYFDWYYHSEEARAAQIRSPISDGAHGEHWIWRQKDLRGWWESAHHDRIGGVRQATASPWVPMSKPIWFTELGCAAIDKGTNEPNRFLDPKSSESLLPRHSTGARDDLIQQSYLRAMYRHFAGDAGNPLSPHYAGRMVDMARAHVWAWDARPFPAFPRRGELWADGGNYSRGHWLNGRSSACSLAAVIAEICAEAGVGPVDTTGVHALVRGYLVSDIGSARAALQPLLLAHGIEVAERDGLLRFFSRHARVAAELGPDALLRVGDDPALALIRAPEAEIIGRVRIAHVESEGDYEASIADSCLPDEAATSTSGQDLTMALTRAEGRSLSLRWLAEARVARDGARFALPPSSLWLGAGDVVAIGRGRWRIDRVEEGGARRIEATRVEPATLMPVQGVDDPPPARVQTPVVPVVACFLDLPDAPGAGSPPAPFLALSSRPWSGPVALWSGLDEEGAALRLDGIWASPAIMGRTLTDLDAEGGEGPWDMGPPLRVQLVQGELASASPAATLAGANLAAIGSGAAQDWELIRFAMAELTGPRQWDLGQRLRGIPGSRVAVPASWPAGSHFVLLDPAVRPIALAPSERGLARRYHFGPMARPIGDPVWRSEPWTFPP